MSNHRPFKTIVQMAVMGAAVPVTLVGCSSAGGAAGARGSVAPSSSPSRTLAIDGSQFSSVAALSTKSTWVGTAEVEGTVTHVDATGPNTTIPQVQYKVRRVSTIKGTAPDEFLVSQIDTDRARLDEGPSLPVPAKGTTVLLFLMNMNQRMDNTPVLTPTAYNRGYLEVGTGGQLVDRNFGLATGPTVSAMKSSLH